MDVYLLRHGEARSEQEDPARPLNEAGQAAVERVARRFAALEPRLNSISHSGVLRARQTAEILAAHVREAPPLQARDGLRPLDAVAPVADWLLAQAGDAGALALVGLGPRTLYLEGGRGPWHTRARARVFGHARTSGRRLMVSEGQAEPWEAVTTPPNPRGWAMYSCPPERLIDNYNRWMRWTRRAAAPLDAYLFWGAEYWVLRDHSGDPRYLRAFARLLEQA